VDVAERKEKKGNYNDSGREEKGPMGGGGLGGGWVGGGGGGGGGGGWWGGGGGGWGGGGGGVSSRVITQVQREVELLSHIKERKKKVESHT